MKHIRLAALAAFSLAVASPALADDYPVDPGDYVSVGMISVDDGHDLEYVNYLAGNWRKQQDYAKSQGWISSYEILTNEFPRAGEPDYYLITRFPRFADPAEEKKRDEAYYAYMKTDVAAMQAGSAERAKYRHQMGSQLLRSWTWKK